MWMNEELGFIPIFIVRSFHTLSLFFVWIPVLCLNFATTHASIANTEHSLHPLSSYHILFQLRTNTEQPTPLMFLQCHHLCQTKAKRTRFKEPSLLRNALLKTCNDHGLSGGVIEWKWRWSAKYISCHRFSPSRASKNEFIPNSNGSNDDNDDCYKSVAIQIYPVILPKGVYKERSYECLISLSDKYCILFL